MPPKPKSWSERLWRRVDKSGGPDACWLWQGGKTTAGYGHIAVSTKPGDMDYTHRRAWMDIIGPIPDGECIRHIVCDNPACCNPAHMATGTHQQNMQDKVDKGRQFKGEQAPLSKLTEDNVREIRRRYVAGELQRVLGAEFGVSQGVISEVVNGNAWKHV